jgi:glyoxylate/hydroxypyruvate reductase A
VCRLPLTDATQAFSIAICLPHCPAGPRWCTRGAGPHPAAGNLLAALDEGKLAAAVLDVCDPEPPGHPVWSHLRIWLTPHGAVDVVLDNIRRHPAGEPLIGLVDRSREY